MAVNTNHNTANKSPYIATGAIMLTTATTMVGFNCFNYAYGNLDWNRPLDAIGYAALGGTLCYAANRASILAVQNSDSSSRLKTAGQAAAIVGAIVVGTRLLKENGDYRTSIVQELVQRQTARIGLAYAANEGINSVFGNHGPNAPLATTHFFSPQTAKAVSLYVLSTLICSQLDKV